MPNAVPRICLVTDRRRLSSNAGEQADLLAEQVRAATAHGVGLVHVRELDLDARTLHALVCRLLLIARANGARLVVNERVDIAVAAGADGVHLPARAFAASRVRPHVPRGFLIGRSVHSVEESTNASAEGGLDYLVFGTVYPTKSKPGDHPVAGPDRLREAVRASAVPVLAIGGVDNARVAEVIACGAWGIAAIGLFLPGADGFEGVAKRASDAAATFDTSRSLP